MVSNPWGLHQSVVFQNLQARLGLDGIHIPIASFSLWSILKELQSIPFWITWLTMELSHETWIQLEACFSLQLDLCKKVAPNKEVQHWWVPLAVVGARPRQPGKGLHLRDESNQPPGVDIGDSVLFRGDSVDMELLTLPFDSNVAFWWINRRIRLVSWNPRWLMVDWGIPSWKKCPVKVSLRKSSGVE